MILVNIEKARGIAQAIAKQIEDATARQTMMTAIDQADSIEQLQTIVEQIRQSQ